VRVVDSAIEPLRVETKRIRHAQHDHLAVLERDQAVVQVPSRHRHVLSEAECVVLIDPAVVARFRAVVANAFESRARMLGEGPSFRTLVASRLRAIQRALALAAIEASKVAARKRYPDDTLAIDVATADAEAGSRHVIDLGQRGLRRIFSGDDTDDCSWIPAE